MEKIISELKGTADKVVKKSGELLELSKVKIAISTTKTEINAQYKILGELVYIAQKDSLVSNSEKIEETIAKINELSEKLNELLEQNSAYKNEKLCPKCKKSNERNALFCSGCGYKYPEVTVDDADFTVE